MTCSLDRDGNKSFGIFNTKPNMSHETFMFTYGRARRDCFLGPKFKFLFLMNPVPFDPMQEGLGLGSGLWEGGYK